MDFQEIFKVAGAIILSFGGSSVILYGLTKWLGGIWASKIIGKVQQEYQKELEILRQKGSVELERLKSSHDFEMDYLVRKRENYEKMTIAMRVHLKQSGESNLKDFLESHDIMHLWASDRVMSALNDFMDILISQTSKPSPSNQPILKKRYAQVIIEMRKDTGFSKTTLTSEHFRFVSDD